jgi:L-alanine-DL-glutamate epimerase-like enolase superfamily enzyme
MKLDVEPIRLKTSHPFKIARSTRAEFDLFIFTLTYDGVVGLGESAPQAYYGESPDTVRSVVKTIGDVLEGAPDELLKSLSDVDGELHKLLAGHASVRAALDMALWDIKGKMEDKPCYELLGANPSNTPLTSFTIGFDSLEVIDQKVDAAAKYKILKVKMGRPGDIEVLDRVIARSGKKVRVDANEGWDVEMAIQKSKELFERGVEFVEQPISHTDEEGLRTLKRLSPSTVILDESIVNPEDVAERRDQGHGINIKLMKCGGITPALKLVEEARKHNLKVMLGCMIETSVAVTAAAQISPLVDYADLDGNLLLAEDPFDGVKVVEGKLVLPSSPGLGVTRKKV